MGMKRFFGRKVRPESRPIHHNNGGTHPISHPLQDLITSPIQDPLPLDYDLRTEVPVVEDGPTLINTSGVSSFSKSRGRSRSGSSGSSGSTIIRRSNRVSPPRVTSPIQDPLPLNYDLRTEVDMVENDPTLINTSGVSSFSKSRGRSRSGSSGSSGSTIIRRSNRVSPPRVLPVIHPAADDVFIDVPNNIEDERQRLVREYTRAHNFWWLAFALDGAVLTCLENCMELGTTNLKAGILTGLYLGFFMFWAIMVIDRRSVMEMEPTILEISAGFVKMVYLVFLRVLFFYDITSSKNMLAYYLFRCIGAVSIKYLASLAALKFLDQRFKMKIANLSAAAPPPAPPAAPPPAPPAAPPAATPNLPHVV